MPSSVEISISTSDSLTINDLNRWDIPLPETSFEHNWRVTSDFDFANAGASILMPLSPSKFLERSSTTMFLYGYNRIVESTYAVDMLIYISLNDTLPSLELSFITSLNLVNNYVPHVCDNNRSLSLALNKISTSWLVSVGPTESFLFIPCTQHDTKSACSRSWWPPDHI